MHDRLAAWLATHNGVVNKERLRGSWTENENMTVCVPAKLSYRLSNDKEILEETGQTEATNL